jgi:hypothetical protein
MVIYFQESTDFAGERLTLMTSQPANGWAQLERYDLFPPGCNTIEESFKLEEPPDAAYRDSHLWWVRHVGNARCKSHRR